MTTLAGAPAATDRFTGLAEPLEALVDVPVASTEVRAGLTAELREVHGGDLAIPLRADRPTVIANFVSTLDGAVALDTEGRTDGGTVSGHSATDRFVMGLLRAYADVVVVGAGTLRASAGTGWTPGRVFPAAADAFRDLRRQLDLAPEPTLVVVTARGDLDPSHPAFRDPAQPIVIASPRVAARRLRTLGFGRDVRIEASGDGEEVGADTLVGLAADLGARVVLSEGGPHVLAELAGAGLLDELFLTLAPQLVGRDEETRRPALLEGVALWPDRARWGRVVAVRRGGEHLFLRYRFSKEVP